MLFSGLMRLPKNLKITVIGGGLGGLTAAIRLRHAGAQVQVLEKNPTVGGKLAEYQSGGYRWDMGPSLLTMPEIVDELFDDIGLNREEHLKFEPVHPTCRYFWDDGSCLDEDEEFFSRDDVTKFMQYAAGIYDISGEAYLCHPPEEFWRAFTPSNWHKLIHLPKVTTFQNVSQKVDGFFKDSPKVAQIFKRFATYNGSSPYKAPATFNIIPYVEAEFGGWYIKGGMRQLPVQLEKIARNLGVEIITEAEVTRINEDGIHLWDDRTFKSDLVVINGDAIRAYRDWIRYPGHRKMAISLGRKELSLSGFVILLGVDHQYPVLRHHNIFFSNDYPNEFDSLFKEKVLPHDPTIYVNITSRSDADHAPKGHDNLFILVNAPSDTTHINWDEEGPNYAQHVLERLEQHGLTKLRDHSRTMTVFTPQDFANRDLSMHGALYGWASHNPLTALFRPPMQSPIAQNLYFVGGTTHPGGGIPLVMLSARMLVDKILRQHGT